MIFISEDPVGGHLGSASSLTSALKTPKELLLDRGKEM